MITDPNVDHYIRNLIPERDDVLKEMEDRAERERIPIIGPVVGTPLSLPRAINVGESPNWAKDRVLHDLAGASATRKRKSSLHGWASVDDAARYLNAPV
jgi:hypothetical protein